MLTITQLYENALKTKERRGWDRIYIAVDIHETFMFPTYNSSRSESYYPWSIATLKQLSDDPEVILILWTCSSDSHCSEYLEDFKFYRINFNYLNENPEIQNTEYACFDKKMYTSMILDDKAGFDPLVDWQEFYNTLRQIEKDKN